ncbi:outer membrane protein assembly factor BamC [Pseudoalteromonas obscura]|uniref:Outer membrane protein assembly factor BamC n=1 Tax=Pseudoalteromonas obscura TaxID=3048491 RepID=A0ABT7EHH0_9GAMM|nr:outer membrane protein assembly factor BamC [Pseudoalteromonas sp. P94(2023)]MDK2594467.1 outer membrane protein assembly factor BamC [Pseudoalteromonas sp. P94(2023)]
MQYWVPKALTLSVILGLSGCSVFTNDTHQKKNYRVHEAVQVPADLEQPYQDKEFQMNVAVYNNDAEPLSFRPPQQVLTLAKGSWAEDKEDVARIYFDKNDGIDALDAFIWQAVEGVIENHQSSISADDRANGKLTTGWYSIIKAEEGWFWETVTEVSRQKFEFTLSQEEHQRTASLEAKLVDYQSDKVELDDMLQQQLEVRALNEVVAEFDYRYRLLEVELRKQQGVLSLELGFDKDGKAALITLADRSSVMERLSNFLEKLSFTVIRLDEEKNEVFVRYEAPENSVWDSIWGDEVTTLAIENGDYTIEVGTTDDGQTSLTWSDAEGNVLDSVTMEALQKGLVEALRNRGLSI